MSTGNRWIPRLTATGGYCSLGCGSGCTKAEFDTATKKAKTLAAYLNKQGKVRSWVPRVWENLGWHWSVVWGDQSITDGRNGIAVYARSKDAFWISIYVRTGMQLSGRADQICLNVDHKKEIVPAIVDQLNLIRSMTSGSVSEIIEGIVNCAPK